VAPARPLNVAGFRAWADVYAMADEGLALVSLLGAQTAVEAVWAYLVAGEQAIELEGGVRLRRMRPLAHSSGQADEAAREVRYRRCTARLPECAAVHLVLAADVATLDGAAMGRPAFLVTAGEAGDPARFWALWNRVCPLPALPTWAESLWQAGLRAGAIRRLAAVWGCCAWRIAPDEAAWQTIIEDGLRHGALSA
jgi:hypothetical protein